MAIRGAAVEQGLCFDTETNIDRGILLDRGRGVLWKRGLDWEGDLQQSLRPCSMDSPALMILTPHILPWKVTPLYSSPIIRQDFAAV